MVTGSNPVAITKSRISGLCCLKLVAAFYILPHIDSEIKLSQSSTADANFLLPALSIVFQKLLWFLPNY